MNYFVLLFGDLEEEDDELSLLFGYSGVVEAEGYFLWVDGQVEDFCVAVLHVLGWEEVGEVLIVTGQFLDEIF